MNHEETTPIKVLQDYLVGKHSTHKNQHYRLVTLQIESVAVKHHSRQITPDTQANDWYGEKAEWDKIEIGFVDGSKMEFDLDAKLDIS